MDFLILRPLPPKTGYHFFEGGWGGVGVGVGGGVKSFCLISYKQWGRTALVATPAVQWQRSRQLACRRRFES